MLIHVLYFQFAFMYLLALVMGLVVYGSDFDSITGWLYVIPLIVITVLHKQVWSRRFELRSANTIRIISIIGALAALFAYAPLHMNYWDEHSITQALWLALLGMCSYLINVIAAAEIGVRNSFCRYCAPGALALIGVFWLFALVYPMIIWFFLGLLFIVSMLWFIPQHAENKETSSDISHADVIAKYAVFVLAIDIGCIIWDHQVNTAWAFYIGAVFMAGAVGFYIKLAKNSELLEKVAYTAAVVNFALAVIWPVYLLWGLHAIVAGLCLGYLLPHAISQRGYQDHLRVYLGWSVWFFMGLVLSNAWYANLQWAFTRLIVLLPFVVLGLLYMTYRFAASKHHV
ncbi:hypothetical protein [Kaarinaea lacus]